MKRLGLGDLGAGWRKDATHASEKKEGLLDFPTRPKLPWLRNAQLLRSQTELFAT